MSCIGTAGHIDHGKSTLVKALTGIDPDRLAEEKERGMTIDLGFAWLTLPGGREVSIVDVPGHEGFIKNMLAGVGGIDAALLVVAADEGVMPQTREHLAILDLLRVRRGVVALTKADLVDEEWLELVQEEIAEQLQPTSLAGSAILPISAYTGQGLPVLVAELERILNEAQERQNIARPRLPIDRVFTMTGFGTVVTGTLLDGAFKVGQEVEILPPGIKTRVRGLQTHRHAVEAANPGSRVAINLANVPRTGLQRGDVVALPGQFQQTMLIDARIQLLPDAARPLAHNTQVDFYTGSQEVPASVRLLDVEELKPGESAWAQLRLRRPAVMARRDRFILRLSSPSMTIGGGEVIDVHPRYHRRFQAAILNTLETLERGSPDELVLAALDRRRETRKSGGREAKPGAQEAKPGTHEKLGAHEKPGGHEGKPGAHEKPGAREAKPGSHDKPGRPQGSPVQYTGLVGYEWVEVMKQSNLAQDVTLETLETLLKEGRVRRVGGFWFALAVWEALREETIRLLREHHHHYPLRGGLSKEEWRARLGLPPKMATEVLAALEEEGQVAEATGAIGAARAMGGYMRLPDFTATFTPEQQQQVDRLLHQFREHPFTPPGRNEAEAMVGNEALGALMEQGTLVKVGNGADAVLFLRESYDEALSRLVAYLREHGKMTAAEARDVLGTTRKYILPLLEHMDERRITRRVGDERLAGSAGLT
ncbi:MAG: selenocysteine-specific translation elongation factor [Chloroflexi bacterium]|nr:MAG: selenocysteine-specific translation elongation factor [Chloroflexota bacterium]